MTFTEQDFAEAPAKFTEADFADNKPFTEADFAAATQGADMKPKSISPSTRDRFISGPFLNGAWTLLRDAAEANIAARIWAGLPCPGEP